MTTTHSAKPATRIGTSERETLLAATRMLAPVIREHAPAAERNRRLSPEVIRALTDAGFFRLLLPRSLGGLEVDPVTCSLISEEIAYIDSATAWALQAGNVGGWWAARLPREGTEEIYSNNPSAAMSAAFHPPQQAREAPGGYRITGQGPLASTIHDSEWLFLTALVMEGDHPRVRDGTPHVIALVLRTREVEIVDTWHSLGMRGTDSNDVVIHDVFVPASRTFPLVPAFEPGPHHRGPLYRIPTIAAAFFTIAPIPLAVARNAIGEVRELAQRKTAFGFSRPLRERAVVQATLAQAEAMLRAARLLYYDTLGAAWERTLAGAEHTLEQKADLLLAATHATTTAATVTDMMHRIAGTSGIYTRSPLERHFRDVATLRHHGFLSENRFEAVGQVYCGVAPEFAMLAF
jgi:indole-3-acetate monooxygenase